MTGSHASFLPAVDWTAILDAVNLLMCATGWISWSIMAAVGVRVAFGMCTGEFNGRDSDG